MTIHQTAVVHPEAIVAKDVEIGPYCVVGQHVEIDSGCVLNAHVVIEGHTKVGKNNQFFPYCSIGMAPQDITYQGEPTRVEIGSGNVFREFISVNRATTKQNHVTKIGNENLFMAYTHLAHDVDIANRVRIVNACNLAGHVTIDDGAIISGATNISQFVTIGKSAFVGGSSAVDRDIPCFATAYGNRVRLKGVNIIGLKRSGFQKTDIAMAVDFFRSMEASALSPKSFTENNEYMEEYEGNPIVEDMVKFIQKSEIGIAPFMS